MNIEDKITMMIKKRREVTFAPSESNEGYIECMLYSRSLGGVSGEGTTAEDAMDAALEELRELTR